MNTLNIHEGFEFQLPSQQNMPVVAKAPGLKIGTVLSVHFSKALC